MRKLLFNIPRQLCTSSYSSKATPHEFDSINIILYSLAIGATSTYLADKFIKDKPTAQSILKQLNQESESDEQSHVAKLLSQHKQLTDNAITQSKYTTTVGWYMHLIGRWGCLSKQCMRNKQQRLQKKIINRIETPENPEHPWYSNAGDIDERFNWTSLDAYVLGKAEKYKLSLDGISIQEAAHKLKLLEKLRKRSANYSVDLGSSML